MSRLGQVQIIAKMLEISGSFRPGRSAPKVSSARRCLSLEWPCSLLYIIADTEHPHKYLDYLSRRIKQSINQSFTDFFRPNASGDNLLLLFKASSPPLTSFACVYQRKPLEIIISFNPNSPSRKIQYQDSASNSMLTKVRYN